MISARVMSAVVRLTLVTVLLVSLACRVIAHSFSVVLIIAVASSCCLLLLLEVQVIRFFLRAPSPPLNTDETLDVWLLMLHTSAQSLNACLLCLYLLALLMHLYDWGTELNSAVDAAKLLIGR